MDERINKIFEDTEQFKKKIGDLVTSFEYPDNNKSQVLLAYHSLIAEHHSAIFLLIQNCLAGSAFALIRALYEPFYRAHWVIGCATKKQIDDILEGKNVFPTMYKMVKEIDDAFGVDNFFQNLKTNSWGPMNDYTHSGLRQISRRFEDREVSQNYETEEIIEVLNGINIALILLALVFFKYYEKEDAFKEIETILTAYCEDKKQTENV